MGISYEECEREFLEFFKLFEKYAFFLHLHRNYENRIVGDKESDLFYINTSVYKYKMYVLYKIFVL